LAQFVLPLQLQLPLQGTAAATVPMAACKKAEWCKLKPPIGFVLIAFAVRGPKASFVFFITARQ
jgi:hypothetical protein